LRQFSQQRDSLRHLARVAEAGNTVLIFPQGQHTDPALERAGDPKARFHRGVAYLAEALGAVVVPFGLAGTEALMPPDLVRYDGPVAFGTPVALRRGPLAIAFGEPLRRAAGETAAHFTARLQERCFALTRQAEAALASATASGRGSTASTAQPPAG
jgi:1-acyl-sn-glycerol-3-phosphate acyltransferase